MVEECLHWTGDPTGPTDQVTTTTTDRGALASRACVRLDLRGNRRECETDWPDDAPGRSDDWVGPWCAPGVAQPSLYIQQETSDSSLVVLAG